MIGFDNNNKGIDFYGIKKKLKISNKINKNYTLKKNNYTPGTSGLTGFGYNPKIKDINLIGNPQPFGIGPKKFSNVPQSYWKANPQHVPIWFQRNDDKKLGGKNPEEKPKSANPDNPAKSDSNKSSGTPGRKKMKREEKIQRVRERTAELLRNKTMSRSFLTSPAVGEARLTTEERIMRGKLPRAKALKILVAAQKRQIFTMAPKKVTAEQIVIREMKRKEQEELKKKRIERGKELAELQTPYKTKSEMKIMTEKEKKKYEKSISPEAIKDIKEKRKKLIEEEKLEKRIEKEKALHERVEGIKEKTKKVLTGQAAIEALSKVRFQPEAVVQRGKEIVTKGVPGVFEETYGKKERARTAKVKRLVTSSLGNVFGSSLTQQRFGPAIRGRPGGPSGKYMIEGKPVFEAEYQKYAAEQRAKNRITPSMQQQTPLSLEQIQILQMQQMQEKQNRMQNQMPDQIQLQGQELPNTSIPMTPHEIEMTKNMQMPNQTPAQRGYTSDEILQAQELAQQQDNILNAPNFLKGQLHATGGSLLTSTGPQILDAPNAFRGQLRNLNRGPGDFGEIKLGERPQTNPQGSEFLDIELGSGKPILRKRISERWMTGESL